MSYQIEIQGKTVTLEGYQISELINTAITAAEATLNQSHRSAAHYAGELADTLKEHGVIIDTGPEDY